MVGVGHTCKAAGGRDRRRPLQCISGGGGDFEFDLQSFAIRGRKKQKAYFKDIMAENFPNLRRYLDIQVYKANKSPSNFNPKPSS